MTEEWERATVECVVCPGCAFTFAACHADDKTGRYSCPECGFGDDTEHEFCAECGEFREVAP